MKSVAVLGGGISGLAAALCLQDAAQDSPLQITLLEGSDRLGGVLQTEHVDDMLLERGPDSFVITKPASIKLAERLGVELIPTRPDAARTLVAREGRLHPLPDGFRLLAPTEWTPFIKTPLVSWGGKARMGLDLILPRRSGCSEDDDETLASFVRRRLGQEALDQLAQPMIAGIYSGDPETLSLRATMPMLLDMERKHRSLILGMRAAAKASKARTAGAAYSLFRTPKDGMSAYIDALVAALTDVDLRTGVAVTGLSRQEERWRVETKDGALDVDAVVPALPASVVGPMLADVHPGLAAELSSIRAASAATINLVWPKESVQHALDGFGFVVPAREGRFCMAATFTQRKYAGRCPDDRVLVRAFAGGALGPEVGDMSDDELVLGALNDLKSLLGIDAQPIHSVVTRYPRRQPQFEMGHLARVQRIEDAEADLPGFALAGNCFRGVGVADCILRAERAVAHVEPFLV
jgi:protoporphyrinogen/coproporphyrinogen III oxidase